MRFHICFSILIILHVKYIAHFFHYIHSIHLYTSFETNITYKTRDNEFDSSFFFYKVPLDMKEETQMKIGLEFQNGFWSSWKYEKATHIFSVDVGKIHINNYDKQ